MRTEFLTLATELASIGSPLFPRVFSIALQDFISLDAVKRAHDFQHCMRCFEFCIRRLHGSHSPCLCAACSPAMRGALIRLYGNILESTRNFPGRERAILRSVELHWLQGGVHAALADLQRKVRGEEEDWDGIKSMKKNLETRANANHMQSSEDIQLFVDSLIPGETTPEKAASVVREGRVSTNGAIHIPRWIYDSAAMVDEVEESEISAVLTAIECEPDSRSVERVRGVKKRLEAQRAGSSVSEWNQIEGLLNEGRINLWKKLARNSEHGIFKKEMEELIEIIECHWSSQQKRGDKER